MKQPTKNSTKQTANAKPKKKPSRGPRFHKKYGTSKLEKDFAVNFLDKLNLTYIYQYEVKEIGRFFDFAVTSYTEIDYVMESKDGIKCVKQEKQLFPLTLLIEVDGDYYHSNPMLYEGSELSPMQKHNKFVDKQKDQWAGMHCIPLLRIWEYDIRNNPKKVINEILKYVAEGNKKKQKKENKKRPH